MSVGHISMGLPIETQKRRNSEMSTMLTIPKLEMSMSEGTLAEWKVEDGATVAEGDVIYVLETDKTARDIEAPAAGKLVIKAAAGETYDCGTEIGEIV
jgi:pyruvate/2-oxoglutarate dehydrogenase complex dihydrolipoamide acyltransferase (E2) component